MSVGILHSVDMFILSEMYKKPIDPAHRIVMTQHISNAKTLYLYVLKHSIRWNRGRACYFSTVGDKFITRRDTLKSRRTADKQRMAPRGIAI